jgi:hypothetical protein
MKLTRSLTLPRAYFDSNLVDARFRPLSRYAMIFGERFETLREAGSGGAIQESRVESAGNLATAELLLALRGYVRRAPCAVHAAKLNQTK